MLRAGYRARHPFDPRFIRRANESLNRYSQYVESSGLDRHRLAQGMDLIGVSGMGKSTALRRLLGLYPRALNHSCYQDRPLTLKQVVWLHLECPSNGGVKAFCYEFFRHVDELIGTSYLSKFGAGNNDTLMMNMARVAAWQALGLLVVDEIQNISAARSGGAEQLINHMVRLRNEIGIPVILVGTPEAEPLLAGRFRTARRGTGWGSMSWGRMSWSDEEWEFFVRAIWRYQFTRTPTELSQDLLSAIYEESQGVTDLVCKVYFLAQMAAMLRSEEEPTEAITPELVRTAAREGLSMCQKYLDALRRGDNDALRMMADVYRDVSDITPQVLRAREVLERKVVLAEVRQNLNEVATPNVLESLAAWLEESGFSTEEARELAERTIDACGSQTDLVPLKRAVFKLAAGKNGKSPSRRPAKKAQAPAGRLRQVVLEGRSAGKTGYQALLDAGLITPKVNQG